VTATGLTRLPEEEGGDLERIPQAEDSPLDKVRFVCAGGHDFEGKPDQTILCDDDFHQWRYVSACPQCGEPSEQATWHRNLLKAWRTPKTEAWRREKSAMVKENKWARFHNMTHGTYAKTAKFYPAIPGKYDICETCEIRGLCQQRHDDPQRPRTGVGPCLKKTEIFAQVLLATEHEDPAYMRGVMSESFAGMITIIQDLIVGVASKGTLLSAPVWHGSKDGEITLVKDQDGNQVYDFSANPQLKALGDMVSKIGVDFREWMMTPARQTETALEMGRLSDQRESVGEMIKENQASMENFSAVLREVGAMQRAEKAGAIDGELVESPPDGGTTQ
jgi:hypothetical protein